MQQVKSTLVAILVAATFFDPPAVDAQELPLLDARLIEWIKQEVSGDAAYEHIRHNTAYHRPRGGSDGLMEVARYYERMAKEYGLADVQLILQDYATPPWNAASAELWIEAEGGMERLAAYLETPLRLADYSSPADVTAELVDVGAGASPEDYAGREVTGRVVLAYGPLAVVHRLAVLERGAAGIVWYPSPLVERNIAYPDQIPWSRVPFAGPEGEPPRGFAFILTLREGTQLRARLAEADQPMRVRAHVDAAFDSADGSEPWQVMVEAYIRGTEPGIGQDIVLTGHMQEEKFSANDDASGTASILEVGRALTRLIDGGHLPRPRRNIRFWWVTEISSQRQYFADNPQAHRAMWVNINHDMVGANQAQDVMRVQNITRLPASRFHFFNDVVESVIDYMIATNNAELAQQQAGSGWLYPKPHTAVLGTRHRYNAKMVFFHTNSDHMPFIEAPIGVPGVSFTNWPDLYIHTSDDDLWNVDRTQLGRNAVAAALMAYIMAAADDGDAAMLAAETTGRGAGRMADNLRLALGWVAAAEGATQRAAAYHEAVDQVRYAAWRERQSARSLGEIGSGSGKWVQPLVESVDARETHALGELEAKYRLLAGAAPPERRRTPEEEGLAALRPALTAGPREFLTGRGRISGVPGLHGLMGVEVLSLIDGERSGLDICRLVAAQAREAGAHYYGTVTAEAVRRYLSNLAEAGLVQLGVGR
jgi:hypothetical protein